jgi:DNA invertase Pin-like site-specific DNA recombinase
VHGRDGGACSRCKCDKFNGQETENQLIKLREFCKTSGWTITNEYVDRKTAKNADREEFRRLYADASKRLFDVVLFWSLDRFSREGVFKTLQHLETLSSYGINYKSFTEQYLDSCGIFKDAVLAILAVIAKQERIRLSERTVAGLERAVRDGKVLGRPKVVVDRIKILEKKASGMSIREIAREMGVGRATVARILVGGVKLDVTMGVKL